MLDGDFWPSLQQPLALLVIPALWLLIIAALLLRRRTLQWEHLIERNFHRILLVSLPRSGRFWPSLLLGLASLCLGLALSKPQFGPASTPANGSNTMPLVILLPLNAASLSTDIAPSRLQLMQAQSMELMRQRLPAQSAMVVYAGSAHRLLPLNNDAAASATIIQALKPELMPADGKNAAAAVALGIRLLQQGRQPQGEILLYSNQLSQHEQQQILRMLQDSKHRLTIIGIGSKAGAVIQGDSQQQLSRLDEGGLKAFCRRASCNYLHIQQVARQYQPAASKFDANGNGRQDQGYWLLLPMLLLLAPLARKGWLLAVVLIPLLQPLPLPAAQQPEPPAELQLIRANPQQALKQLDEPMWLGIAAYHAGDYQLASQHFASATGAAARYNQANALMQLGQYQQAIELYQQALLLQPQLSQASSNLQLARQLAGQQAPDNLQLQQSSQQANTPGPHQQSQQDEPLAQQADLHTWLRQINHQPDELLQQTFWYEYINMENQP